MRKTVEILDLFLSSPIDVSDEKVVVAAISNEINDIWSRNKGVRIEIIDYENLPPTIDDDIQKGVNRQVPDYDLYLGIMWNRIGTPTPRAASGTVEEFNIAYDRYRNGKPVEIMFYFKQQTVLDEQSQAVMKFKSSFGVLGVRYKPFLDKKSFEYMIRSHLSNYIQEKAKGIKVTEKGLLDKVREIHKSYLSKYEFNFKKLIISHETITKQTSNYSLILSNYSTLIKAGKVSKTSKLSLQRDLSMTAKMINIELNNAKDYRVNAFESISKLLMWLIDINDDAKRGLVEVSKALIVHKNAFKKMWGDYQEYNDKPQAIIPVNSKTKHRLKQVYLDLEKECEVLYYSNEHVLNLLNKMV